MHFNICRFLRTAKEIHPIQGKKRRNNAGYRQEIGYENQRFVASKS